MDSDERQNDEVGPESTTTDTRGLSEVDHSSSEPAGRDERGHQPSSAEDQLEFFGGRGAGGGNESGSGEESPEFAKGPMGGRDSNSPHGAFVTISPPLSPGELFYKIVRHTHVWCHNIALSHNYRQTCSNAASRQCRPQPARVTRGQYKLFGHTKVKIGQG